MGVAGRGPVPSNRTRTTPKDVAYEVVSRIRIHTRLRATLFLSSIINIGIISVLHFWSFYSQICELYKKFLVRKPDGNGEDGIVVLPPG
jgi:hypothetical protein